MNMVVCCSNIESVRWLWKHIPWRLQHLSCASSWPFRLSMGKLTHYIPPGIIWCGGKLRQCFPYSFSSSGPPFCSRKNPGVSVQNIRNTFLILSCSPFPVWTASIRWGMDSTRCQAFHRDAGQCWIQCVPQLCEVGWMSFGWWTSLDTHGKLLSVKHSAALQFLTLKQVQLALTTIPHSKALKSFVLPIQPLNCTHT